MSFSYETKRISDIVLQVNITYKVGQRIPFLLLSDLHYDHPYCDRDAVHGVMDAAKKIGAPILLNGDTLCMMQARDDKRGSKDKVRDEHKVANYFDAVVIDTAEQLSPYADHLMMVADGNHETAIVKRKETNPLDWLVHRLNTDHGGSVHRAGYHGIIRFKFRNSASTSVRTFIMYHHHGKYGGMVTKGVLGVARHGLVVPQADCIWTGHTHTLWHVTQPQLRVNRAGHTYTHLVHHIKTGTWKDEFNRPGGFGVEKIANPTSQGGYWMTFWVEGKNKDLHVEFKQAR